MSAAPSSGSPPSGTSPVTHRDASRTDDLPAAIGAPLGIAGVAVVIGIEPWLVAVIGAIAAVVAGVGLCRGPGTRTLTFDGDTLVLLDRHGRTAISVAGVTALSSDTQLNGTAVLVVHGDGEEIRFRLTESAEPLARAVGVAVRRAHLGRMWSRAAMLDFGISHH